jgi:hypothetical protein
MSGPAGRPRRNRLLASDADRDRAIDLLAVIRQPVTTIDATVRKPTLFMR